MNGSEPDPGGSRGRGRSGAGAGVVAVGLVAAVVLVLLLSSGAEHRPAPPAGQVPAKAAPSTEQFGVSVNRLFSDATYSPQQIEAQLAALHATGATIARSDALWEATEPAAPVDGGH